MKFVQLEDRGASLAGDFIAADVSPRSSPEPEDEREEYGPGNDHSHYHGHEHANGHVSTSSRKKDS